MVIVKRYLLLQIKDIVPFIEKVTVRFVAGDYSAAKP